MALSAGCQIEVRNGGSDTICSGAFDPTQTAGMFTDGAATSANTSAPVFSSASYNFVAGDVGAYVFIGAGTNWTKGWYVIASVASNQATLTATASGYQAYSDSVNTSAGCASVASPTGATWSIDYSQQAAAEFTCTDGTAAGAGSTLSSATIGFGSQMVGNAVRITTGTNCTTGHHVITSVAAGVATFNNAVTTGVTSDCTLYLGGALASIGYAGAAHIAGNTVWIAYNAATFTTSSATSNVTNGRFTAAAGSVTATVTIQGYFQVRGVQADGANRPTLAWGVNAGGTNLITGASYCFVRHLILNGVRGTYTNAFSIDLGTTGGGIENCKIQSFTGTSPYPRAGSVVIGCEITDCTGGAAQLGAGQAFFNCYYHDNVTNTYYLNTALETKWVNCIFDTMPTVLSGNSGTASFHFSNCVFYNITGSAVSLTSSPIKCSFINCIFDSCTAYGLAMSANYPTVTMRGCAFFNNTSGKYQNLNSFQSVGELVLTVSPFVDAANGDFRLNMKTGGGALLRGAGYPQTFPGLTWAHRRDIGAHQHSGPKRGING